MHWDLSNQMQWDLSPTTAKISPKSTQTRTLGVVVVLPCIYHHGEEGSTAPMLWPQAYSNTTAIVLFGRGKMSRYNTPVYSPFAKLCDVKKICPCSMQ